MAYRNQVALVFLIGFFIDCINIFMSAIALPAIAAEFQVSSSSVTWVANAYILGLTLIIPISTWLASRFGARQILAFSMILFTVAVILCGFAGSFNELVFWRFIQGVGGGLLIPVGQSLTFSLFKNEQRARVSTMVMAVALIAPAISPAIGGAIVDHYSWRWVFFSNIPFSLLASFLAWLWIKNQSWAASPSTPDIRGLLLVSIALTALLIGMSTVEQGQNPQLIFWTLLGGMLSVGLYIWHYKVSPNAIIDLSLLKNKKLNLSILIYYAVPGVFTGVNLLNIFFLQNELKLSAEKTGLFMLIYAIGAFAAMMICGRIYNRVGPRILFIAGLILHSLGIAALFFVHDLSHLPVLIVAYALMGSGGGLCANAAQTTALIDFTDQDLPKASVIWNINRQMSFSIGAAFFTMLLGLIIVANPSDITHAYHLTFLIAAGIGLLPILLMSGLTHRST